jgi:hypothetical protein
MRVLLNDRLLEVARDEGTLLCYPHAQRTGGRTIRKNVFAKVFGESRVYNRHYTKDAKPWGRLKESDLAPCRAWTDLSDYRDIRLKRPCAWLAVLRHPVYRAASLYHYVRGKEGHPNRELANRTGMEDFYREASRGNPKYYRNVQTMRVCGRADARAALDLIKREYLGVGFTNSLAQFVGELGEAMGWPVLNIATKEPDEVLYGESITQSFRNIVLEENREDLILFERVAAGDI